MHAARSASPATPLEVFPPYDQIGLRIEWWGDTIQRITRFDPLTGEIVGELTETTIFPASHYVASDERMKRALGTIEEELHQRLAELNDQGKLLEAERLRMRTSYDLEMMREVGFCSGIENYSRHIDGRGPGTAPYTLLDYFPDDYLVVIDESHVTVPQLHGMYEGDLSRKSTLVEHGFRLPSAIDNRPLRFDEFTERVNQVVFMSATPGDYELRLSKRIVEQIVRPTGLIDPEVQVRPTKGQVDDLIEEIRKRAENDQRILVTTLTKKMAEDLTDYLVEMGIRVRYLHSEVDTLQRIEILRDLRLGSSTCWSASTCCAKGSTCPRCRSWPSSTPTRRVPSLRDVVDPDDRARGPQRGRHGADVRRPHHRLHEVGHQRDPTASQDPARVQRRAQHRPADDPSSHLGHLVVARRRHHRRDPEEGTPQAPRRTPRCRPRSWAGSSSRSRTRCTKPRRISGSSTRPGCATRSSTSARS